MSLDTSFTLIKSALLQEHEAGPCNGLHQLAESRVRRETIRQQWQLIQAGLATLDQQIKALPSLPPQEQIAWAQAVLTLPRLAFLEIDTTGLDEQDEIIRFTLINSNFRTIDDMLIKPTARHLSAGASRVNGIQLEQLEQEGIPVAEAWERIQAALYGRYVISYSQEWDVQQLKKAATRYHLEPITIIGDDLQRHTFQYYHREYHLTLAGICERIGHPLPDYPHQTSLDRAKGQFYVLTAISNAITDVRPIKTTTHTSTNLPTDGSGDGEEEPPF